MTPALLELSRAYAALPGAPTWPYARHPAGCTVQHGVLSARDDRGIRWIDCQPPDSDRYEWLPDLTDPATGGVMLDKLGPDLSMCFRIAAGHWVVAVAEGAPACGDTLAEAVARVAVARGRAA